MSSFMTAVRSGDFNALSMAASVGPEVVPLLATVLGESQVVARELAMECLSQMRIPEAKPVLLEGTRDRHVQVAMAAAGGLETLVRPVDVPEVMAALAVASHPLVRRGLALMVGRLAGPGKIDDLRQLREAETSSVAREGLVIALARLGDESAREAFVTRLEDADEHERRRWLEDCRELECGAWLLPSLGRLLDDDSPLARPSSRAPGTSSPRVCDLALQLIARLAPRGLGFECERPRRFSTTELDAGRRLVAGLR